MSKTDHVVRALTNDGAFRVITAVTTKTVRDAVAAQEVRGITAEKLGQLVTGAILIREAMSPERRVQILIKDSRGRSSLVADANPTGWNRGIVGPGWTEEGQPDMAANSVLQVMYTLPNGVMHEGVVSLPESGDISTALMTYMQESEQIVTMVSVAAQVDPSDPATVRMAGGYLVQLMPGAERESIERMTAQLSSVTDLESRLLAPDASADALRAALLGDIETNRMSETYLVFGCNCSRERVMSSLLTLPQEDLDSMLADQQTLEIHCEACRAGYRVTPEELRELMGSRDASPEQGGSVN